MSNVDKKNSYYRPNTYLNKECFKLIVYAPTKERSDLMAQWLTGSTNCIRGIYGCPYNNTQMITFFRWPEVLDRQATTVAIEGIVVFVDDENEWNLIYPEIQKYSYIPFLVIVSKNNLSSLALRNNATYFKKEETNEGVRKLLDELDKEELARIRDKFDQFDKNGNKVLEVNELRQIAASLSIDPYSDDFSKAVKCLDFNEDGQFNFGEFMSWWKIGRQNVHTLPKLYEFYQKILETIHNNVNYQKFENDMRKFNSNRILSSSDQKLYFKSNGEFKIRSFIEFSLAIGGQKRIDTAVEFLSQFTKNTSTAKNNWISLLLTLNPSKGLNSQRAKLLLDESYRNFINWVEVSISRDFAIFLKNLLIFETSATENAVILVCRFKIDIEDIVKSAISKLLFIFHNLADEKKSSWINIIVQSNTDFYNDRNKVITLRDFFNVCELQFEGSGSKFRNSILLDSLNGRFGDSLEFLKLFLLPQNIDIEYIGNLSELIDNSTKNLLEVEVQKFGKFLEILKKVIVTELIEACTDLQIGVNTFDLFAKFKFTSPTLFSMK